MKKLTFYFCDDHSSFSLSPYDSDALSNLVFMEQIIGTLVKYSMAGRYEPFLADKWLTKNDGKTYLFHLRDGLLTQKGTKINARNFTNSITLSLKYFAKRGKVPAFENLKGWNDFVEGKKDRISGINYDETNEWIIFDFEKRAQGLMDYLAMPYYGFQEESDKNIENGEWLDKNKITATGAYEVLINDHQKSLTIVKRENYFSFIADAPAEVTFINETFEKGLEDKDTSIILKKLSAEDTYNRHFNLLKGTPTILVSLVISPFRNNAFKNQKIRYLFNKMVKHIEREIEFFSYSSEKSDDFFITSPFPKIKEIYRDGLTNDEKELLRRSFQEDLSLVITKSLSKDEKNYLFKITEKIRSDFNIVINIFEEDRSDKGFFQKITSNKYYDLRIAKVDIGGQLDEFIIGMMFCSKLGVGFPDPENKMCSLIDSQNENHEPIEIFSAKFNEQYTNDSVVLPLWHSGLTWLMSEDIDLKTVTSTMGIPRFDTLRIK